MDARFLAALIALPMLAAGCVSPAADIKQQAANGLSGLLAQPQALWDDHQNEPFPGWDFPTLTHPANGTNVPALWKPIPEAKLPDVIKGLEHVTKAPDDVKRGAGMALFGSIAVVPGFGAPTSILDISDPTAPKVLSQIENKAGAAHRGAAFIPYPQGRLVFVVSTPKNIEVYDITDPTKPVALPSLEAPSHKVGVVPGTPIVYNAASRGGNVSGPTGILDSDTGKGKGVTEIFDLTDPDHPVKVQDFKNGYSCHHVYFWNDASQNKFRATCAGVQFTQIWDIADPKDPKVIVSVPVHHGNTMLPSTSLPNALAFSHFAILNAKGNVLIVGDETGGGGLAACDGKGPFGNVWFYDVKDEKNPKLLGWFDPGPYFASNPPSPGNVPGCTAHHGRLVPSADGKTELLAMAYYGAGVVLIDFTNPQLPKMLDQWNKGTNTWEVWYYNGYLFTGDMNRGLDVLKFK